MSGTAHKRGDGWVSTCVPVPTINMPRARGTCSSMVIASNGMARRTIQALRKVAGCFVSSVTDAAELIPGRLISGETGMEASV